MAKHDFERFQREVRARLDAVSPEITAALGGILARRFTRRAIPELRVIEDNLGREGPFPVVLDFVTPTGTVLADKTEEILGDRGPLLPPKWVAGYEALDPTHDWRDFAAEVVIEWVANCWAAAGGRGSGVKMEIGSHNSTRRYDLDAGRWRDDEE